MNSNSSSGSNCNSIARLKSNQNIQVYIRVRPPNERERLLRSIDMVHTPSQKEITVRQTLDSKMTKKFTFDRTFGQNSTQHEVYSSVVAPLIEEVISGYNCTVFAYGQTGTGKTHTMIGDETPSIASSHDDTTDVGIIPRALSHLFDELRLMEVEFSMRISFLELYNEELSDLLSSSDNTQIRIFDDANKKGSIIVQGLEEIPVHNTSDVYKLLAKGQEKRKTATTLMNAQSSRSHTIFSILVHIKENGIEGDELLKIGKLNLVDLAGSENITKAGNEKGIRTRETVNINQSLLTLGRVITALVERTPHIPYRESKLTRLLQESLGGRTKTSIIATISPGHKDLEETLNTLEYAHRAKHIQNKPEVNQKLTKKAVIKEYTEEIDRLKRDLMAARDKNGIYLAEDTYIDMQYKMETQSRELNEKMLLLKALKDDLASKQRLFNEISLCLVERTEELKVKENVLEETKTVLGKTKKDLRCTKRRYQEKKHLLETHIRTEYELTGQAYQLKDVANCATTDTYKLHETIERRQTVENQSNEAMKNFRDEIHVFLNIVQTKLDTMNTEFQFNSQTIQSEIDSHIIEHKTFSDTSIADLNNFIKFNETATVASDECLKKYESVLSGMTDEQQKTIHQMLNDCAIRERLYRTTFGQCIEEQRLKLAMQKNSIDDHSSKLSQQITKITKIHEEFCNRITNELKQQTNCLLKQLEDNQSIVQKSVNRNKTIATDFKNIIEQMQNLLKTTEENNVDLEMTIPKFKHFENDIQQYNTTELQSIDKHLKNYDENTVELKNAFKDVHCDNETHFIANELFINQCLQSSDENSVKIIESIAAIEKEREKQTNELMDTVRQNTIDIQSQLNANEIAANNNCSKLIECIHAETVQCENYALGNSSLNNLLAKSMETFHVDSTAEIVRCYDSIDNFYSNKLKSYTSTGNTPIRKKYDFPQKIIATSPHNRLLQRFRATNNDLSILDCSAVTIPEDSQDDIENETIACTTPSQLLSSSVITTPNNNNNVEFIETIDGLQPSCENDNIITTLENDFKENSPIGLDTNQSSSSDIPVTILSERTNINNCSSNVKSNNKKNKTENTFQVINDKENVSG